MANITPEQIESLLSELQVGLNDLAKKEAEVLAKTHPGEESKPEVPEDKSATEPKTDGPPAKDDSAGPDVSATAPADASAAPAAPPADMSADPSAPGSADPAAEDDGPVDPVKLHEEYSKLSPEDLKAHYIACKAALFELVGSGNDGSAPDASAPPVAPPAGPDASMAPPAAPPASPAASPSPPPDAPPTMKGEMDTTERNGGPVAKSEKDVKIEELELKLKDQDEAIGKLVKVVETVMTAPMRKSVVSLADLPAAKDADISKLSRDEVKTRLRKASEGKLSKSDQDLIVKYDFGKVKVQDVAHLLVSKVA